MCNHHPWKSSIRRDSLLNDPRFYEPRTTSAIFKLVKATEQLHANGFKVRGGNFGVALIVDNNSRWNILQGTSRLHVLEQLILGYGVTKKDRSRYTAVDRIIGWTTACDSIIYGWSTGTSGGFRYDANNLLFCCTRQIYNHYTGIKHDSIINLSNKWLSIIEKAIENKGKEYANL